MIKKLLGLAIVVLFSLSACSNAEEDQTQSVADKTIIIQGFPNTGKVIKAMHGGGYTYMQVENKEKTFWVAATMMNIRRDDIVSWTDAAVMKNFKSSTLRRTFDEILFVTSASVKK